MVMPKEELFKLFSGFPEQKPIREICESGQEKLRGKKARYTGPYFAIRSKFKKMEIKDNVLKVTMDWKNKRGREKKIEFEFGINELNIILDSESVSFSQNLGKNFKQQFTIFF